MLYSIDRNAGSLWLDSVAFLLVLGLCGDAVQASAPDSTRGFGPYNATFLAGGVGLSNALSAASPVLQAAGTWSLTGWVRPTLAQPVDVVIASVGNAAAGACRCLALENGTLTLSLSAAQKLSAGVRLEPGTWYALAATYDGHTARLFVDGREAASAVVTEPAAAATLELAPVLGSVPAAQPPRHFGGSVALFTLHEGALAPEDIRRLVDEKPDFDLIVLQQVGVGWPFQERAWRGLQQPQDPETLPRPRGPQNAVALLQGRSEPGSPNETHASTTTEPPLRPAGENTWALGAWRLIEASRVSADGAQLAAREYRENDANAWYPAVVPGTVLTTLIARGVYPDPYYGLNNLAIPEKLSRQDYWYRTTFEAPVTNLAGQLTLTFKGINYRAEVWLNGTRLGEIRGAFTRGVFDVTRQLLPGRVNALAVHISPPPHPGIAHEESIAAGPGENGGNLALDGPTFIAAEGWDWIPGIRDRNTGIWQGVELHASGVVRILDPHVVTSLPLPRTDAADVSITVPLENHSSSATPVVLQAEFEGVHIQKSVTLVPGVSEVSLEPGEFAELHVRHPRLWWPNGYGSPELYALTLSVRPQASSPSPDRAGGGDSKTIRFGIRQLTYELSLFDHEGRLRRVEVDPTAGTARGERLVDIRHTAIKKTPNGWAESLTAAGESSTAVRPADSESLAPYLTIRVNGVRIAARGGSWGTDDALKRVSRERLEPYFRLHREANVNIIRNWLGQDTEDVFYDLADEYGLLILNDFWESTQDFQLEAQDPALFLANARDVILRYRNHPSIAVWFGRNEGVPQPIINEGLGDLVATLDGTRYYTGSSNSINLQGSGPYNYRPPVQYFTELAHGFSVEVGTASLSSLESLRATLPPDERWPISDTLAYHDWHFGGNGNVASFMTSLSNQFGAPTSLEDFERKAQMMNLVSYRAIFEGFQAHLWTENSGRLLWMTHPAWPSNSWQIYSSDYDTAGAYYGVKNACEPLHAQMNLPDFSLAVVNTTREARKGLRLLTRVVSLDDRVLATRTDRLSAPADATTTLAPLELAPHLQREGLVLVELVLEDAHGARLSRSVYWQGQSEQSHRLLNSLPSQPVSVSMSASRTADSTTLTVTIANRSKTPVLAVKLTAVDPKGERVLPVYYSDNYVSLLPGEHQDVTIQCPTAAGRKCDAVQVRGWNVQPTTVRPGQEQ